MEVFAHLPHALDVVPSDFHLFWPLKDNLRGRNLRSEEEVIRQRMSDKWRAQQPKDFFSWGIYVSVNRWKKCAESDEDYAAE